MTDNIFSVATLQQTLCTPFPFPFHSPSPLSYYPFPFPFLSFLFT
ncbi:hypothetical protein Gotur_030775 [Gossypium turneri]